MVPILVFLTFVAFIVVARVLSHGREAAMEGVPVGAQGAPPLTIPAVGFPTATYLHPGHAWVRFAPDGMATVGATEFAANFAGALASVEAPPAGRVLRQGEPAWTLVSTKNRRLTQAMPVDGEIVEVNQAFRAGGDGGRARPDWILRVRPARLAENLQNLVGGTLADAWQEVAGFKLNAALAPALGRIAHDGGVWMENFGDVLSDADWIALRRDLFPPQNLVPPQHGAEHAVR